MKDEAEFKINRRSALAFIGGAVPLFVLSATEAEASKMSQKTAHYIGSPKNGKSCNGCKFFEGPNSCKIVDGNISPNGWCMLWAPK